MGSLFNRSLLALAMLAFAGNSLLCRVALKGGAIDAASITTVRLVSGAITLAALVWLQRKPSPQGARTTALPGGGLLYALASGALTSGLGYAVWYRVLPALQATHAATVQLSVPVIAAVGGVVLLGEAATWPMALSGCAILGGIGLVIWKNVRVPTPDRRPPTA